MIATKRLTIAPSDTAARAALRAQWLDGANERLVGAEPTDQELERWLAGTWAVRERATGDVVGDCTLFFAEEHDAWELAYGFRRDRWGRGYATEAAGACIRHGFDELGLARIVADVDPANIPSVRVLEKLGFERVRDAEGGRMAVYELTRER